MKKLLFVLLLFIGVQSIHAQETPNTEYMELRLMFGNVWSYRLSPQLPFQKMGLFGQFLRPHFKEHPEAMRHFKNYRWNMVASFTSSYLGSLGLTYAMLSYFWDDTQGVIQGSSAFLVGVVAGYWFLKNQIKQLQMSVDAFNRAKNPQLSQLNPFLPQLQPTASSAHLGLGLVWHLN